MTSTEELLEKYEALTTEALTKAKAAEKLDARAAIVLDMASCYVSDALHFKNKGDAARALAAFSYAHGWLDAGARCRLFIVTDNHLFTVDGDDSDADKEDETQD